MITPPLHSTKAAPQPAPASSPAQHGRISHFQALFEQKPLDEPEAPLPKPSQAALQAVAGLAKPSQTSVQTVARLAHPSQTAVQTVAPLAQPLQKAVQTAASLAQTARTAVQSVARLAQPLQRVVQTVAPAPTARTAVQTVARLAQPSQMAVQTDAPLARPLQTVVQTVAPLAQTALNTIGSLAQPGPTIPAGTIHTQAAQPLQPAVSATASDPAPPTTTPAAPSGAPPQVPGLDLREYTPIQATVALNPLLAAIKNAGIDPNSLQFDQLQAYEAFPGRADLSYTTQQILIRGPKGAQLFDLNLALKTPWVTAAELRYYGVV
jgi:hypothetical protein